MEHISRLENKPEGYSWKHQSGSRAFVYENKEFLRWSHTLSPLLHYWSHLGGVVGEPILDFPLGHTPDLYKPELELEAERGHWTYILRVELIKGQAYINFRVMAID